MAAMKDEISERENVIAQNYTTIQLLRKRLADLEKHKYVLGFRTQVRKASRVPTPCPCVDCRASWINSCRMICLPCRECSTQ